MQIRAVPNLYRSLHYSGCFIIIALQKLRSLLEKTATKVVNSLAFITQKNINNIKRTKHVRKEDHKIKSEPRRVW